MKMWCRDGAGHEVKVRFNPAPGERVCPAHGTPLGRLPKNVAGNKRAGLPGEATAHARFRQEVLGRPCFFLDTDESGRRRRPGHICEYPLDPHHIVAKSWLKRELIGLPLDELVALLYAPIIGAPLCRAAHTAVTAGTAHIYRDELEPDLVAFCERFDVQHPDQRSLLERLYLECPERKVAAR